MPPGFLVRIGRISEDDAGTFYAYAPGGYAQGAPCIPLLRWKLPVLVHGLLE
jgi:hypothetical protein